MTDPLRDLGKPRCFDFVGDSHVAAFDGLVLEDAAHPGELLLTKSYFQPFFRAEQFFSDGRFGEYMTRLLVQMRCAETALKGWSDALSAIDMGASISGARDPLRFRPIGRAGKVVVVSVGEVDAADLANELFPRFDIDVGSEPSGWARLPDYETEEVLPRERALALIRERAAPLFAGLSVLREAGFSDLFLHDIPPPGPVEFPHWKPARYRYKIRWLFNRVYREWCVANDVGFLSTWDDVTVDDLRSEKYDRDHLHLNRAAAIVSVMRLSEILAARASAGSGSDQTGKSEPR
jgi:hypothetical protein